MTKTFEHKGQVINYANKMRKDTTWTSIVFFFNVALGKWELVATR